MSIDCQQEIIYNLLLNFINAHFYTTSNFRTSNYFSQHFSKVNNQPLTPLYQILHFLIGLLPYNFLPCPQHHFLQTTILQYVMEAKILQHGHYQNYINMRIGRCITTIKLANRHHRRSRLLYLKQLSQEHQSHHLGFQQSQYLKPQHSNHQKRCTSYTRVRR